MDIKYFTDLKENCSIFDKKGFDKVIFERKEKNGYDDSDFFYLYYDENTKTLERFMYGSTRFAGSQVLERSIQLKELTDSEQAKYKELIEQAKTEQAKELIKKYNFCFTGDTVQVANKKARKFKDEIFQVSLSSEYRFHGRYTYYLHSDSGIKTAVTNCKILESCKNSINRVKNYVTDSEYTILDNLFFATGLSEVKK